MPRGVKKENLPSKICVVCQRPYTWRKKWEAVWNEVATCSKSCNRKRRALKQQRQRSERQQQSSISGDDDDDDDDYDEANSCVFGARSPLSETRDLSVDTTADDLLLLTSLDRLSAIDKEGEEEEEQQQDAESQSTDENKKLLTESTESLPGEQERSNDDNSKNDKDRRIDDDDDEEEEEEQALDPRAARKAAKKAKKALRRAQREGRADPTVGQKPCTVCGKSCDLLIRCQIDVTKQWHMVCGKCWNKVSGGVVDGSPQHPHYTYGGLWKNRAKRA